MIYDIITKPLVLCMLYYVVFFFFFYIHTLQHYMSGSGMCPRAYSFDHPTSCLPIVRNCREPFRWKRTRDTKVRTRTRSCHFAAGATVRAHAFVSLPRTVTSSRTTMTQTSLVTWSPLLLRQGPVDSPLSKKMQTGT